jgi:hypothetical protein
MRLCGVPEAFAVFLGRETTSPLVAEKSLSEYNES